VSQTESPHQRTSHLQQRWPTAESDPYSDLFQGWFWAEVASLSSMKIVQTEKSEKKQSNQGQRMIAHRFPGRSLDYQPEGTFDEWVCAVRTARFFKAHVH